METTKETPRFGEPKPWTKEELGRIEADYERSRARIEEADAVALGAVLEDMRRDSDPKP